MKISNTIRQNKDPLSKYNSVILYCALLLFVMSLVPNSGENRMELMYGVHVPFTHTLWLQCGVVLMLNYLANKYRTFAAPFNWLRWTATISVFVPILAMFLISVFPFSHPERPLSYYDIGRFTWIPEHVICSSILIVYFLGILFGLMHFLLGLGMLAYKALKK